MTTPKPKGFFELVAEQAEARAAELAEQSRAENSDSEHSGDAVPSHSEDPTGPDSAPGEAHMEGDDAAQA